MDVLRTMAGLILSTVLISPSYAVLISQNSVYGRDSITLDTDTGLQWLDPWLAIVQGGSGCGGGRSCGGIHLNSYYDIKAQLGEGGYYEGFRYATRQEVETLIYSSTGVDPFRSRGTVTSAAEDAERIAHLMSFTDSTYGGGHDANYYWRILDAVFEDPDTDSVVGSVLSFRSFYNEFSNGYVTYYTPYSLTSNTNPYGHWLVRDTATAVSEPASLATLGLLMLSLAGWLRRKRLN